MGDLLDVLYEQYEKLKHANASFMVIVAEKKTDRSYIFTHKDDFLNEFGSYINNFILIRISSGYSIKKIEISLYNHVNKESNISVTSDDSDWSRNIRAKITEVLENHRTHYDFLHSRKSWIVWTAFGPITMIGIVYFQPPKTIYLLAVVLIVTPYGYAYLSMSIIRWMFPRFVIENSTQMRFRRWILVGLIGGTIVGVIAGLIVGLIVSLLRR
jgi:hypothetical protein